MAKKQTTATAVTADAGTVARGELSFTKHEHGGRRGL
jgi:hypothetical protein